MKICIYGKVDESHISVGGQLDKTEVIVSSLQSKLGAKQFTFCNLYKKNTILAALKTMKFFILNDRNICVASYRGIIFFTIIFHILGKFKRSKNYCIVVGNIEVEQLTRHPLILKWFQKLHGIFLESNLLKNNFKKTGCNNVFYFPNCKRIKHSTVPFIPSTSLPLKFCTYSRVTRDKGILDAIEAIKSVNELFGDTVCQLDIYGPVDQEFYCDLCSAADNLNIKIRGELSNRDANGILEHYIAMLFPTHHKGEGVSGCVINALESGLPIIATDINSNPEVIEHGKCGYIYQENNKNKLISIIEQIIVNPQEIINMRHQCLNRARDFDIDYNINQLLQELNLT